MEGFLGVRKGAWVAEEDNLLKKCIEKYGEGKWHQVSLRAGLNRCRKSCRLRWLNYLKPNIKRGEFGEDEVDLILRLHKLLGNRWALIAGRIPGRTANDVKNFWNTHLRKKEGSSKKAAKANVIKPQPRTFTKNLELLKGKSKIVKDKKPLEDSPCKPTLMMPPLPDCETMWWESLLLADNEIEQRIAMCEEAAPGQAKLRDTLIEENQLTSWSTGLFVDVDLWNLS